MDVSKDNKFYNHPKVRQARRLLVEAEQEICQDKREEIDNELCECGHARQDHGTAYSINYTGGMCKKCGCINFLSGDTTVGRRPC